MLCSFPQAMPMSRVRLLQRLHEVAAKRSSPWDNMNSHESPEKPSPLPPTQEILTKSVWQQLSMKTLGTSSAPESVDMSFPVSSRNSEENISSKPQSTESTPVHLAEQVHSQKFGKKLSSARRARMSDTHSSASTPTETPMSPMTRASLFAGPTEHVSPTDAASVNMAAVSVEPQTPYHNNLFPRPLVLDSSEDIIPISTPVAPKTACETIPTTVMETAETSAIDSTPISAPVTAPDAPNDESAHHRHSRTQLQDEPIISPVVENTVANVTSSVEDVTEPVAESTAPAEQATNATEQITVEVPEELFEYANDSYLPTLREYAEQLQRAFNENMDVLTMRSLTHKIMGSALAFGFVEVNSLAKRINTACHAAQVDKQLLQDLLGQFSNSVSHTVVVCGGEMS